MELEALRLRRVLLGVGGGIAAYRVAELARLLTREGVVVDVVMTEAAERFVTPLTFAALTGREVYRRMFALADGGMRHIRLVREADALLVAPCTADLLARLAHGIADDLLTTLVAARGDTPLLLAPAMNPAMWGAEACQRNVRTLRSWHRVRVIPPDTGQMACGEHGEGRLPAPDVLHAYLRGALLPPMLRGQRWLINAGPTEEPWDAVRVLTNRASGRLGALLASQAAMMGAEVILVAGPGTPDAPACAKRIDVCDARQMLQACEAHARDCDVFIASAAVCDYAFAQHSRRKMKRTAETLQVTLCNNPDIVAHIARMAKRPRWVVAFAAESEEHCRHARQKLEKKGVDAIIANDIRNMGGEHAGGWWLTKATTAPLEAKDKLDFSRMILSRVLELQRESTALA